MKNRLQEFLQDMDIDKKKLLFILGGAVLTVLLLVIVLSTVLGGSGRKYEKYYKEAEAAYLAHDYEEAEEKLRSAMDIQATEKAYLLMADIYTAQGEADRAIQILYLGYSHLGGEKLAEKLEQLKSAQSGYTEVPAVEGTVTVAGKTIDSNATALVLTGNGLSSADRAAISTLKNLESLSIGDCGISDLGFLSGLTKLTFLQISDNAVRDLGPLSKLTGLKNLYIDKNPIANLEPLYALTNLRTLSMKGVDVPQAQLDALKKALPNCSVYADVKEETVKEITLGGRTISTDVTELNLSGLGITDISALSACKSLEKLDLRDNKISDISPLVDLQDLQWLCIWNNEVEDIYPLLSLRQLKYLDADGNKISDVSVLQYLTDLEELWLNNNPVRSVEPLRGLVHLIRLGLAETELDDSGLDCLMEMKDLKELNIKRNPAISKAKFDELQALIPNCVIGHDELRETLRLGDREFTSDVEELIVNDQSIDDLSALKDCKKLRVLNLMSNRITDLSPLRDLTSLEELYLSNNAISDLSPLSGCTKLKKLFLSGNSIRNLAPLAACAELTELHLGSNEISDISALSNLTKLTVLDLENNQVSDLSALYALQLLESLRIRGNGLTADDILALQTMLPKCVVLHDVVLTETDLTKPPEQTTTVPSSNSDLRVPN